MCNDGGSHAIDMREGLRPSAGMHVLAEGRRRGRSACTGRGQSMA